ncbi:hypothetical protein FGO68_gene10739 [Halteria grandinella]|uniref:Uncharacterized protein n=1 Tax=Halteria grandinella TaxID=5974 RepID=A0A8J8T8G4_HALGN|nr:hypothetical protein FGO68_gene10739 [Halteria grandinella]
MQSIPLNPSEDCPCNRGQTIKYYCAQEDCILHKDSIFFCDHCFNDIMLRRQPHFILQIAALMQDISTK